MYYKAYPLQSLLEFKSNAVLNFNVDDAEYYRTQRDGIMSEGGLAVEDRHRHRMLEPDPNHSVIRLATGEIFYDPNYMIFDNGWRVNERYSNEQLNTENALVIDSLIKEGG